MRKTLLVVALALAACSSENDSGQPALADPTTTTTAGDETTSTEAEATEFKVGDRVETGRGNFVTLHAYEQPVPPPDEYTEPQPGQEFAAVDVEFCAEVETGDDQQTTYYVGPGDWELQMGDNTRRSFDIPVKEPSMSYADVPVGDCLRGWVSFQVPAGEKPEALLVLQTEPLVRFLL